MILKDLVKPLLVLVSLILFALALVAMVIVVIHAKRDAHLKSLRAQPTPSITQQQPNEKK